MQGNIIIQRLVLVESGTYNPGFARPYAASATPQLVNHLKEVVHRNPHAKISPIALSGIAGELLAPMAKPQGGVIIPGGWEQSRFFFLLEVLIQSQFGNAHKQVITGFTDRVAASLHGTIDPQMVLHPNSVTTMRQVMENRGYGMQEYWLPSDNSQILTGFYEPTFNTINQQATTLRPMDVFDTISLSSIPADAMRLDLRNNFASGAMKSRRENNISSNFLSRVLNAASDQFKSHGDYGNTDEILGLASEQVAEGYVSEDNFYGFMRNRGAMRPDGGFHLSSIFQVDPALASSADTRMDVIFHNRNSHKGLVSAHHVAGSTQTWGGEAMVTVKASQLAQAVPALLSECLLSKVHLEFTNRTLGGHFQAKIAVDKDNIPIVNGFVRGLDTRPFVHRFLTRLETEIWPMISHSNRADMWVFMAIEITGETWIKIKIGEGEVIDYVYPSFCDALLAPTMSPAADYLGALSGNMGALINNLAVNPTEQPYATSEYSPHGVAGPPASQIYQPHQFQQHQHHQQPQSWPTNSSTMSDPYEPSGIV